MSSNLKNIRRFAEVEQVRKVALRKTLNLDSGMIKKGMAELRVLARFPHLGSKLTDGLQADPLLMLIDLSPFSEVAASLSAEEIADFLDAYYRDVVEAVESIDGVVDKYIGDAVLSLFGNPFGSSTDEKLFEVVEVGKKLVRYAVKWFDGEVCAKVAIDYGSCFVGYVGPEEHRELTIVGNPLTTLFRLLDHCDRNQVIMRSELINLRPTAKMAPLLVGANPKWSRASKAVQMRGVSLDPVDVTSLSWHSAANG
jgi:class 3 adenylate cyclase